MATSQLTSIVLFSQAPVPFALESRLKRCTRCGDWKGSVTTIGNRGQLCPTCADDVTPTLALALVAAEPIPVVPIRPALAQRIEAPTPQPILEPFRLLVARLRRAGYVDGRPHWLTREIHAIDEYCCATVICSDCGHQDHDFRPMFHPGERAYVAFAVCRRCFTVETL